MTLNITNNTLMNGTYDLTTIISEDIIENPIKWLAHYNYGLGGYFVITFLIVLGFILYRISKERGVSDPKSVMFAGFVCTLIGLVAFLIEVVADPAGLGKIITWAQIVPFVAITIIALIIDKSGAQY